ncbi:GLPGLI family protein [Myroides odoratimimus]|uniref:GLPGLI family protein n=1 Tax=Myroides odoratimimus TaxID=76832 RepID=UPI002576F36B|nr:GLPGLI family protein [Myroides odoratimimus]MDM1395952.1 GLPGLI family protein [Myroides odoratimimus]
MNKLLVISIVAFITSISGVAQEKIEVMRYEYQLVFPSWEIGSEKSEIGKREVVYLDIYNNKSRCISEGSNNVEELLEIKQGGRGFANKSNLKQYNTKVRWSVYANQGKLSTYLSTGLNMYNVEEINNLIKWNISGDIEDYNGMKVQKAVGELSGRTWAVWFTQDIPLIDGPYKFKNLPGFVVKAEDSTGDYKFEFLKSEKVITSYWLPKSSSSAQKITKEQWNKLRNAITNKNLIQMLEERGTKIDISSIKDKTVQEEMNRKIGKEDKPIEFY